MKMLRLRNYVCAFLRRDDRFLLMRRAPDRDFAPGLWSGVGGKMEPPEINNPLRACLREIEEETGIPPAQIHHLRLRYLITRRAGGEIRQSYVFFGETPVKEVQEDTREGQFCWVPQEELLHREFTSTYAAMLAHWQSLPADAPGLYLGVAAGEGEPVGTQFLYLGEAQ